MRVRCWFQLVHSQNDIEKIKISPVFVPVAVCSRGRGPHRVEIFFLLQLYEYIHSVQLYAVPYVVHACAMGKVAG